MSLIKEKVYVLHHSPLAERKKYLTDCFNNLNISVEWVESFLPESLEDKKVITKNEYSLLLKHIFCYREQILNNYEKILILEDDCLLDSSFEGKNFVDYYNICMEKFNKSKYNFMFLGCCCNLEISNPLPGINIYYHESFLTRCAHCYVITLDAAKKAVEEFMSNFLNPADHFLNHVIRKNKLKSCYTHPSVYQGSGKVWKSSLR